MTEQAEQLSAALPQTSRERWLYSLKPASWPKLLVPMLLGQTLGFAASGQWRLEPFLIGAAFTLFGLAFIVLLNDWSDQRVDALKRTMFPGGGSPKTIHDGVLSASQVGVAGMGCGVIAAGIAWFSEYRFALPWAREIGFGSMMLFVAYSLPPIRLNYRGGGEVLEMLGVGAALPYYNAYLQAGPLGRPWVSLLAGFALLSLGSAIASGLSDEKSDRRGGKRTVVTIFGNHVGRRLTELAVMAGMASWAATAYFFPSDVPVFALVPGLGAVAWNLLAMRSVSDEAVTNSFKLQALYKRYLHRAIWYGAILVALGLIVHACLT